MVDRLISSPTQQWSRKRKTIGLLGIKSLEPFHQPLSARQIAVRAVGKTWLAVADSVQCITKVALHGQGTENVAGVVGVAQLTGQVAPEGMGLFLPLIYILPANLALMNPLPIPILQWRCALVLRGRNGVAPPASISHAGLLYPHGRDGADLAGHADHAA